MDPQPPEPGLTDPVISALCALAADKDSPDGDRPKRGLPQTPNTRPLDWIGASTGRHAIRARSKGCGRPREGPPAEADLLQRALRGDAGGVLGNRAAGAQSPTARGPEIGLRIVQNAVSGIHGS